MLLSCSVETESLRPHGLQHARLPFPSPSPGACSNSYPLNWWCHSAISSCHPLLHLPSIFLSIRVFPMSWLLASGDQNIGTSVSFSISPSSESVFCIRWPKFWNFSLSISPTNEYSGLISFRIDWFDLLADQGTLKILLQHHS